MIECTSERIYKKKKYRKRNFKRFKVFFLFFLILISLIIYYKKVVFVQIEKICALEAEKCAVESVNDSVLITLSDRLNYSDIMQVEYAKSGEIVLMQADAYKVNYINKTLSSNCQKLLVDKLSKGVSIPIMAFSGIGFLSGYGKAVDYKTISVLSVNSSFSSQFTSVGINQTKHSIYVDVTAKISIGAPLITTVKNFDRSVLICETVLVGKVPEIYLNGKIFS